jgi:hypothetical protein
MRSSVTDGYVPAPRAEKIADWVERLCLAREQSLGRDRLVDLGAQVGFKEADVALGLHTMSRRSAILGPAYPFRVAGGAAAAATAHRQPWTSMLLMGADSPVRTWSSIADAASSLERITAVALTGLFGPGTRTVRFAWPTDEGRPQSFDDAVRWLASLMNVPAGTSYRPPHTKDGGVDVVAWRPFPDGRSGFPVMLVQCTLERDYTHKAKDIDLRVWSGWLSLDVDPSTALAIPDVVANGNEWQQLSARTVVLDRLRLASLVDGPAVDDPRLAAVQSWTEQALARLRSDA